MKFDEKDLERLRDEPRIAKVERAWKLYKSARSEAEARTLLQEYNNQVSLLRQEQPVAYFFTAVLPRNISVILLICVLAFGVYWLFD